MKKIITVTTMTVLSLGATSLSHDEINTMVSKIKEERVGINLATLESTPNPFAIVIPVVSEIVEVKEKIETPKVIKKVVTHGLSAILNHAAFIDGKWYKIGDKVGVYTLREMGKVSVVLKNKHGQQKLIIPKNKKKFKMFKGN
jgi:hypothetical protein